MSTAMTHRSRIVALACVAALALGGCGSAGEEDGAAGGGGGAAPGPEGPGRDVYEQRCASCHGVDLRGTTLGPSQLSVVYEPGHHPDASYRAAIVDGVVAHHWGFGDMAPVPGLSDEEIDAVIAYIRAVQDREGFEPYPPQ